MLVLSRQRDETIMIGDNIEITIVDIRGDKVRLGITAPTTIAVHRKEVYDAIQRENREAAKVKMEDLPNLPPPAVPPGGTAKSPAAPGTPRPAMPVTRPPGSAGEVKNPPPGRPPSSPPPAPPAPSASTGPGPMGAAGAR
jgi:carbon storage regulator